MFCPDKNLLFFFMSLFVSSLCLSSFRWPLKGYSPAHRRRPLLRLYQRQLHRCKWKRIECYYWLPTKPTKPHPLARMSGLYTFLRLLNHPSCHRKHIITYRTCVSLSLFCLSPHSHERIHSEFFLLSSCSQSEVHFSLRYLFYSFLVLWVVQREMLLFCNKYANLLYFHTVRQTDQSRLAFPSCF